MRRKKKKTAGPNFLPLVSRSCHVVLEWLFCLIAKLNVKVKFNISKSIDYFYTISFKISNHSYKHMTISNLIQSNLFLINNYFIPYINSM